MATRAKARQKNQWSFATHKEDVPPKAMARRAQAAMASMPGAAS
jgi:hypothetical protein